MQNPFKIVIPHTPGTDDPQHIGLVTRWQLTKCLYQAGFVNYQFFYAPLHLPLGRLPRLSRKATGTRANDRAWNVRDSTGGKADGRY